MSLFALCETNDRALARQLEAVYARRLPDQRIVGATAMIYNGRVFIGDEICVHDAWCYESVFQAVRAVEEWDPLTEDEPKGWIRHPQSGRRRPLGNPEREYIRS